MPVAINSVFFSPCAWDLAWHSGAIQALLDTKFSDRISSVGGGSGGSLAAFVMAGGTPTAELDYCCISMALRAKGHRAVGQMSQILGEAIDYLLPIGREINKTGDWLYAPYATVSMFGKEWPYVGAHIIRPPQYADHDKARDLIMASCYIPGYFEKPAIWEGARAYDGGTFIWDIHTPGTVNVSPHRPYGPHTIGYKNDAPFYLSLQSFLPDQARIHRLREEGYDMTRTWIRQYG